MSSSNELKMPKEENYRIQQMLNICEQIPPIQLISVHLNLQGPKWYNLLCSIIWMWDFLQAVSEN